MKKLTGFAVAGACAFAGSAFAGDTMWSIFADEAIVGTFDVDAPGTFTPLPNALGFFAPGLSFDANGNLFVTDLVSLYSVDRTSGVATLVGGHGATVNMQGLAYNPVDGLVYGTATDAGCGGGDSIYSVDTNSGAATLVCATPLAGTCGVDMAIDANGVAYLQDIISDAIYGVDVAGCVTNGYNISAGFDMNFSQGLDIAPNGDGWVLGFNNVSFVGELWSWDVAGGTTAFAGNLGGGGSFNEHNDGDVEVGEQSCLDLTVDATLTSGQPADFTLAGGTPFERGAVVWGVEGTGSNFEDVEGWCATFDFAVKLNGRRIRIVGSKFFDENGEFTITKTIPAVAQGLDLMFQGAERNTCPGQCLSQVEDRTIL